MFAHKITHKNLKRMSDILGENSVFNSMAEKWEEVLDSQKDAPIFSKWSATDEIKFAKLTSHPNYFCRHSTQKLSLDHKETGQ